MCGVVQVLWDCPQYSWMSSISSISSTSSISQIPSASSIIVSTLLYHKTIDDARHQRIRNNYQLKKGKQDFVGCVYFVQFHFLAAASSLLCQGLTGEIIVRYSGELQGNLQNSLQTWNLSKNLHDQIFGQKNFTHWKRVNWDYFCQQ